MFYLRVGENALDSNEFETLKRATIPLADSAINILRKHFVNGKGSMKRATNGGQPSLPFNILLFLTVDFACTVFDTKIEFALKRVDYLKVSKI